MGAVMTMPERTLCAPDMRKTCFACCPPIRPAGYEHIRHKPIIKRMLRENSLCFRKEDRGLSPITGFSCWALGYLDKEYRRIGCLLHPLKNKGMDLRYRVDYGEKCRRESCPESKTFSCLHEDAKSFWLRLARDLDSFAYSSREENPLFHMLGWGTHVLGLVAAMEGSVPHDRESFFEAYPFFQRPGVHRPPVYPAKRLIDRDTVRLLKNRGFREGFERFSHFLSSKLGEAIAAPQLDAHNDHGGSTTGAGHGEVSRLEHPVHRLPLDRDFLDYLRLFVGIQKINLEEALRLKSLADEELARFRKSL
jgi:hypothetical protein